MPSLTPKPSKAKNFSPDIDLIHVDPTYIQQVGAGVDGSGEQNSQGAERPPKIGAPIFDLDSSTTENLSVDHDSQPSESGENLFEASFDLESGVAINQSDRGVVRGTLQTADSSSSRVSYGLSDPSACRDGLSDPSACRDGLSDPSACRDGLSDLDNYIPVLNSSAQQCGGGGVNQSDQHQDPDAPSFRILDEIHRRNDIFKISHRVIQLELSDDANNLLGIPAALAEIIDQEKKNPGETDFVGFVISPPAGGYDLNIEFKRQSELSVIDVVAEISGVAQSNNSFYVHRRLTVEVVRVNDLRGKGQEEDNYNKIVRNGHMIIIKSAISKYMKLRPGENVFPDFMCLINAVAVGLEHVKFCASKRTTADKTAWRDAKRQNSKKFAAKVQRLYDSCNFDLSKGGSIAHIQALEQVLKNYRIVVYDGRSSLSCRYSGYEGDETKTTLYLYYDNDSHHYNYVSSIAAFFGKKYFCDVCRQGINNRQHLCVGEKKKCRKCLTYCDATSKSDAPIKCNACFVNFASINCYQAHQDTNLCAKRKVCESCGFMYRVLASAHVCGTKYCKNCSNFFPVPHFCFLKASKQPRNITKTDVETLTSFADFESTAVKAYGTNAFEHVVNVAHIQTVCYKCRDVELEPHEECDYCCGREHTIHNLDDPEKNVVTEFLNYCSDKAARKLLPDGRITPLKNHLLVFHYASGYDSLLCLQNILGNSAWNVESVIMQGRKILMLKVQNVKTGCFIKLIDFYNYIPQSLASLPAAFNLPEGVKKGDFPHLMNRPEYYGFNEQRMPDLKFWAVDEMPVKKRQSIIEWHTAEDARLRRTGGFYNFRKEILDYCRYFL